MTGRSPESSKSKNTLPQENASENQLRKFALAVEHSTDSIMITTPEGIIGFVNPAFCRASGYAVEELIGQNPRMLQSGLTPTTTYQSLWQTLTSGNTWQGEFINRHKNGDNYTDVATIAPLRQPDGQITHYVAVQKNVTELKQTTAELSISENRLRLAQSATGLGVYDRDLIAGTINWDTRTRELFGVHADAVITHDLFMDLLHPDDKAGVQAAHDRALNPSGSGIYHARYRINDHKTNSIRYIEADGQVFFEDRIPMRLVGVIKDVTERNQLELDLKSKRNEMRQLVNQQIAAHTAAAIAHEINQPLASASVYTETALRMLQNGTQYPDKLEQVLKAAVEQAHRAGHTLHALLTFLHKGDIAVEPVDLDEVVRDALSAAEESGCNSFSTTLHASSELRPVLSNRLQLQKVLVNLLCNSAEAMCESASPNHEIIIRIQVLPEKNMAQTSIQDSGPGLSTELARKVFDPFFTTKKTGIGLGLAISRSLIEAQGGRLWVDANTDSGAVFHFTLPLAS